MVARRHSFQPSLAETFEQERSDYSAAKSSRYRRRRQGVSSMGSGADYHYRSEADYLRLMEEARDFDRNDLVVGQLVDRAVTNTTQGGFQVAPNTGDEGLNKDLYDRFTDWGEDPDQCDIQGESTFAAQEDLAFRATLVDGDIFALPQREGSLQMVEAHRCRTPSGTNRNVVHGVLLDDVRKRLEYWFTKDDIGPLGSLRLVNQIDRYAARDEDGFQQVFHIYNPKRVSQTRGVTAFAPVFDAFGMFEDINFAKMVQQQVVSCFGVLEETVAQADNIPSVDQQLGERSTQTREDGTQATIEGIRPGMVWKGRPGVTLKGFSPAVPNAEFFEHVKLILTLIGINFGLPLILVLMDASQTNFSGWRGAVDQARLGFKRNQRSLISRFHKRVWNWKVRQWIADDPTLRKFADNSKIDIFKHRWKPPRWPYIQPFEDAQTDLMRVSNGLTSRRRFHEEDGGEWEDISTEIVEDNAKAIIKAKRKAIAINTEFNDDQPVHWRELISLPMPSGFKVDLATQKSADAGGASSKPQDKRQEAAA